MVLDALFHTIATRNALVGAAALEELHGILDCLSDTSRSGLARSPDPDLYPSYAWTLPVELKRPTAALNLLVAVPAVLGSAHVAEAACRFALRVCNATIKWTVRDQRS